MCHETEIQALEGILESLGIKIYSLESWSEGIIQVDEPGYEIYDYKTKTIVSRGRQVGLLYYYRGLSLWRWEAKRQEIELPLAKFIVEALTYLSTVVIGDE